MFIVSCLRSWLGPFFWNLPPPPSSFMARLFSSTLSATFPCPPHSIHRLLCRALRAGVRHHLDMACSAPLALSSFSVLPSPPDPWDSNQYPRIGSMMQRLLPRGPRVPRPRQHHSHSAFSPQCRPEQGDARQLLPQLHPAPAPFPGWVYRSCCFLFRSGVQKNNRSRCGSHRTQSWQAGSCLLSHRPAGYCLPLPAGSRDALVLVLWASKASVSWKQRLQERPGQFRTQQGEGTAGFN